MKVVRNMRTKENRDYWASVEAIAAEAERLPWWMTGKKPTCDCDQDECQVCDVCQTSEQFWFTEREIQLLVDSVAMESAVKERNGENISELEELGQYLCSRLGEDAHRDDRRLPRRSARKPGRERRAEQESASHGDQDHARTKRRRRIQR